MTLEEALPKVERIAEHVGGEVYRHYSGRGMYGAECIGVSCDHLDECIEEAALLGMRGGLTDNLGKGYVVYWPKIADPYVPAES